MLHFKLASTIFLMVSLFFCLYCGKTDVVKGNAIVKPGSLTSLVLTTSGTQVSVGTTQSVVVTGVYADGTTQILTSLVNWNIDNSSIAIANPNNFVTGVLAGTSILTASYGDLTSNSLTFTCSATQPSLVSISILALPLGDMPTIVAGVSRTFLATGVYSDTSTAIITNTVNWSSSTPATATVSMGIVTGVAVGTTLITASYNGMTSNAVPVIVRTNYSRIYVSSTATNLSICSISALTYSGCTTVNASLNGTHQTTIWNNYIYFANVSANNIIKCTLSGSTATSCAATGTNVPTGPTGIAFYGSYAYITNATSTLYRCSADSSTGVLGNCTAYTYTDSAISVAEAISFYGNYAYITRGTSSPISFCIMKPSDSQVQQCSTTTAMTSLGWTHASGLTFSDTYLYATSAGSNLMGYCKINTDASLTNCYSANPGVNGSFGIASDGARLFISNLTSNSMNFCTLSSVTGLWGPCNFQAGISNPMGIAIN